MKRLWICVTIIFCFVACSFLQLSDAGQAGDERIHQLIKQLGSEKFADREKAQHDLEAIGKPALKLLYSAFQSGDPEIRDRSHLIVKRVEDSITMSWLLTPKKVKLAFKNTPISQALSQLEIQSGYPITFEGDSLAIANRTVTFSTGEVTFWEAFDKLCAAANLMECPVGFTAINNNRDMSKDHAGAVADEAKRKAFSGLQPIRITARGGENSQGIAAKSQDSLRWRLIPSKMKGSLNSGVMYVLDVAAEPRLRNLAVLGFPHVEKAIDDVEQLLVQDLGGEELLLPNGQVSFTGPPLIPGGLSTQVGLGLKLGEKPARTLKAIGGWVTIQCLSEPEPQITVNDVMNAKGKVVEGLRGGVLEVVEVNAQPSNVFRIQVRYQVLPKMLPLDSKVFSKGSFALQDREFGSLMLLDGKGQALTLENVPELSGKMEDWDWVQTGMTMIFRAGPGVGPPAQLVMMGQRVVTAPVPFRFENVPLP